MVWTVAWVVAIGLPGMLAVNLAQGQVVAVEDSAEATTDHRATVQHMLDEQTAAWNTGDLEAFMKHYWNSGELTFSSGGRTTRGWRETRDRYLRRYPDRATMGQLSFDDLEVYSLGTQACFVLGRWSLDRDTDKPTGNFTLVVRKIGDRWLIVHDHTSVLEEPN